jgi:hypothetical protein
MGFQKRKYRDYKQFSSQNESRLSGDFFNKGPASDRAALKVHKNLII